MTRPTRLSVCLSVCLSGRRALGPGLAWHAASLLISAFLHHAATQRPLPPATTRLSLHPHTQTLVVLDPHSLSATRLPGLRPTSGLLPSSGKDFSHVWRLPSSRLDSYLLQAKTFDTSGRCLFALTPSYLLHVWTPTLFTSGVLPSSRLDSYRLHVLTPTFLTSGLVSSSHLDSRLLHVWTPAFYTSGLQPSRLERQ